MKTTLSVWRYALAVSGLLVALPISTLAQSDVTQPGDPVIASSDDSPGSEGVANAIDNQPTKYLNFDSGTDNDNIPSGLVVSPSVGATVVTGISIQSANDAVDRDILRFTLEGSNDEAPGWDSGNWEMIHESDAIEPWTELFPGDDRFQTQTFTFENGTSYLHYRWTVVETQGPSGCCMQVAEIELLGSVSALPGDVTQPGDAVIASSDDSPGSEGVANAIDDQPTKYLNFDSGTNNDNIPSGLVVTPSLGATVVTGVTIQSANDAVDRDIKWFTLEGSNDEAPGWDSGDWEMIYENEAVPSWVETFPGDDRFQTQTFVFPNILPYAHYRWTVIETQEMSGCCMQVAEIELLGRPAPVDVTQPGDPAIASSDDSPGSEGVANAIDNQPTKYLNFDSGTDNDNIPSGFVVSPAVGATTVVGISMQSANDAVDRDPVSIRLEGSNDESPTWDSGDWAVIYENDAIPSWVDTFPGDDRFQTQNFYFENTSPYLHYRWTVLGTQGPSGCCMQIAEVELLAFPINNCDLAAFLTQPVSAPTIEGVGANFFTEVNGPWTVRWLKNGEPIPGASQTVYTTDPVTADNVDDVYSVEIVGCDTSDEVQATLFDPAEQPVSIGINFVGGGANGAPTRSDATNIGGGQLQAYWNSLPGEGDGSSAGEESDLLNSRNEATGISVEWSAANRWGSGTGRKRGSRPAHALKISPLSSSEPSSTATISKSSRLWAARVSMVRSRVSPLL